MKMQALITVLVLATSLPALAQTVTKSFRSEQKFSLVAGGSLVLENPAGDIDIVGTSSQDVQAVIITKIVGTSQAAIEEGRRLTSVIVGGDARARVLRSSVPPGERGWTAEVNWQVSVPRSAHVKVASRVSNRVRLVGVQGNIHVKNFNGTVILQECPAHAVVDSVNGSIIYESSAQPMGNVTLKTLNGHVSTTLPQNADIRWVADTARGDIRTNMPARGAFFGTTFRGSVNAPGGPTLTTASLMGNIQLLARGRPAQQAQSLRSMATITMTSGAPVPASGGSGVIRGSVRGLFAYSTNMGDVSIEEILGDADIHTGAGAVKLGAVSGSCKVSSLGGPLQLGEISGPLSASTRAGNILVDSARRGGTLDTVGGSITLLYTSGPTRLVSGGGDITVRQAAGPIEAFTRSGDIAITFDPTAKTQKVEAKTYKGNITLHIPPGFGADIDAIITTSDPNVDTILSDVDGLSIRRATAGNKTEVRATGRINGGGERLQLNATDGSIRISSGPVAPTVVMPR
jgi:DUF4097 and DUF4098 domain-containing protein YvlB